MLGRSAPSGPVFPQGQRWGPWPQRTLAPLDHGEGTHRRHVHWHPWHWHTGTRTGMSSPLACTRRPGPQATPLTGAACYCYCYKSSSHSRVAPTFTLHSSHIKHTCQGGRASGPGRGRRRHSRSRQRNMLPAALESRLTTRLRCVVGGLRFLQHNLRRGSLFLKSTNQLVSCKVHA